jgi:23S rRNA (guanosine2251-2'-O)-methyltransferase
MARHREERGAAPKGAPPGTLWIYGWHPVAAVLANPARRVRRLVVLADAADSLGPLVAEARADLPPRALETIERRALEQMLPEGAVHQGVAAAVDPLPRVELADAVADLPPERAPHVVVVLDQVTDPHNIGAILRSAAAFAACAVVVPEHGAPAVTGVIAKAASGALETVPLVRAANLVRALERLKDAGFWSVGLDAAAPQSLNELDLPARVALVLGAEGSGLRRLTRETCDFLAHLPTRGTLASLNVSNAAAVALYALTAPR